MPELVVYVDVLEIWLECADCAFPIRPNTLYIGSSSSCGRYESVEPFWHACDSAVISKVVDLDQRERRQQSEEYRHAVHEHDVN